MITQHVVVGADKLSFDTILWSLRMLRDQPKALALERLQEALLKRLDGVPIHLASQILAELRQCPVALVNDFLVASLRTQVSDALAQHRFPKNLSSVLALYELQDFGAYHSSVLLHLLVECVELGLCRSAVDIVRCVEAAALTPHRSEDFTIVAACVKTRITAVEVLLELCARPQSVVFEALLGKCAELLRGPSLSLQEAHAITLVVARGHTTEALRLLHAQAAPAYRSLLKSANLKRLTPLLSCKSVDEDGLRALARAYAEEGTPDGFVEFLNRNSSQTYRGEILQIFFEHVRDSSGPPWVSAASIEQLNSILKHSMNVPFVAKHAAVAAICRWMAPKISEATLDDLVQVVEHFEDPARLPECELIPHVKARAAVVCRRASERLRALFLVHMSSVGVALPEEYVAQFRD
jgi:hypothetical protein